MGSGRHPDPFVDMIGDMLLGGEPGEAVAPVAPGSSVALNPPVGDGSGLTKLPRRRAYLPTYLEWFPPVSADVPTIATAGPGGVSGVASAVQVLYNDQAKVTLLGARPVFVNQGSTDYWQNQVISLGSGAAPFTIEFDYYGKDCAIWFRNAVGNQSWFWVWVNGQPVTVAPVVSTANTPGSRFYYRLTWATSAHRRLRIDMQGADYGGVDIGPIDTAAATAAPGYRLAIVGDSFVAGTGATSFLSSMTRTLARMLNVEFYQCGYGGTGYTVPGAYLVYGDAARVAALSPQAPDEIWFLGSTNDAGSGGTTTANAALAAWNAYQAACPKAKIRVIGVQDASGNPSAGNVANNTAIKNIAVANGYPFFADPINENWITGTGNVGAPNGTGNADVFCSADGLHPSQAGHDYWARRLDDAYLPLMVA